MAITFRQITSNITNSTNTSGTLAFGSNVAAGSLVVICAQINDNNATNITISDDVSDTYTDSSLGFMVDFLSGWTMRVGAFFAPTAGARTFTATFSGVSASKPYCIWGYEIAGLTSPSWDRTVSNLQNGSGTTATAVSGALSSANEACMGFAFASTFLTTVNSPWSSGQGTLTTGNNGDGVGSFPNDGGGEHQVVSATTSQTASFTLNSSNSWSCVVVTIKGAAAAAVWPPGDFGQQPSFITKPAFTGPSTYVAKPPPAVTPKTYAFVTPDVGFVTKPIFSASPAFGRFAVNPPFIATVPDMAIASRPIVNVPEALVLQPPAFPTVINQSFDIKLAVNPPITISQAFSFRQPVQNVPISGIAWFEPPESGRIITKPAFSEPQSFPVQLPSVSWPFTYGDTIVIPDPPVSMPIPSGLLPPAAVVVPPNGWWPIPDRAFAGIKSFTLPFSSAPAPVVALPTVLLGRTDPVFGRAAFSFPSSVALIPSTLPTGISGMGWFEPLDRPIYSTKAVTAPAAAPAAPPTLPTPISGMGWFEPPDILSAVYNKPQFTTPPSFVSISELFIVGELIFSDSVVLPDPPQFVPPAFRFGALPTPVSGMAWFEPFDQPVYSTKATTGPASLGQQVTTTPVSGMGWFEPPEKPFYGIPVFTNPWAGLLIPPPPPTSIAGMSWFERWSVDPVTRPVLTIPSAVVLIPSTLPAGISGMAWMQRWSIDVVTKPTFSERTALGIPTFPSPQGWFNPLDQPNYTRPNFTIAGALSPRQPPTPITGMGWFEPLDIPVYGTKSFAVATAIGRPFPPATSAWFQPLDIVNYTKPSFTPPSPFSQNPATLPPRIAGMAWFQPFDIPVYSRPVYTPLSPFVPPRIIIIPTTPDPNLIALGRPRTRTALAFPRKRVARDVSNSMSLENVLIPNIDSTVEKEIVTFDYGKTMQPGVTITSISFIAVTILDGFDPSPTSRLLGGPTIGFSPYSGAPSQGVYQLVGTCLAGVTYGFQCVANTSDGQALSIRTEISCT